MEPPSVLEGRMEYMYVPEKKEGVPPVAPPTMGEKLTATGATVVGGAVKAGTAVGSAVAGGAGYVYDKTKAAAQISAEKTKAVIVL